ncbi:MAG: hypothetical protein RSD19_05870, partial [Oscillospiraceae bacterium]
MSKIKSIIAASLVASVLLVGCTKGSQEKPVPPENVPNDTSVVTSAVTVPPASESVDAAVSDAVTSADVSEYPVAVASDITSVLPGKTPVPDKNASATGAADYELPLPEPSPDAVAKISKDCKLSEAQMLEKIQAYADSICPYVDVKPDILRAIVADDKSVSFDAINVVDGKETVVYSVKSYKNILDAFTCLYETKALDID